MRMGIQHFVVSSVLAHVAIFAAWTGTASPRLMIPTADASAPSLHIAIETDKSVAHEPYVRHTPKQRKVRHSHKARPQQQVAHTRQITTPLPVPHHSNPPVNTAQSAYQAKLRRDAIRSRVLSQIRTDLKQYFVYPLLAQRQGWQGRVVLAFSVAANGMIRNIRVASGSGYPILDTSAVTALSRVRQLYPHSDGQQSQSMQLQLPVIFELQGG